jgi:hypothetical protein
MAGFVPPTFSNHGKAASDLFKKKFDDKKDFKHVVQTKNKTASGLVFTSGGDFDSKNTVTGNLKLNYKKDWFGEFEGSVSTAGPAKAELKLKKLVKGLTVTLTGDTAPAFAVTKPGGKPAKFTHSTVKVGADYSQEFVSASASAETQFWKPTLLTGAAVIGFDGLSVGGEVKLDTDTITKDVDDYNVAAEYKAADFTATLKTQTQGSVLVAQYHQNVNADVQVGGEFKTPLDGSDDGREFGVASEYKVDASTVVKARASTAKVFAVAVEHRLPNPRVQLGVASQWDIVGFSAWNPKAFGLSLTFGDYDA